MIRVVRPSGAATSIMEHSYDLPDPSATQSTKCTQVRANLGRATGTSGNPTVNARSGTGASSRGKATYFVIKLYRHASRYVLVSATTILCFGCGGDSGSSDSSSTSSIQGDEQTSGEGTSEAGETSGTGATGADGEASDSGGTDATSTSGNTSPSDNADDGTEPSDTGTNGGDATNDDSDDNAGIAATSTDQETAGGEDLDMSAEGEPDGADTDMGMAGSTEGSDGDTTGEDAGTATDGTGDTGTDDSGEADGTDPTAGDGGTPGDGNPDSDNPDSDNPDSDNPDSDNPDSDKRGEGESCSTGDDCTSGICEGLGCDDMGGTCVAELRACTDDLRQYCGCDGRTFTGSGSCPNARYQNEGPCAPGSTGTPASGASSFNLRLEGATTSGHATVLLWGYDTGLADVSATLIEVYEFDVSELPTSESLPAPNAPHTLIDGGSGDVPEDAAHFYFTVYIDVDGDGQICAGDFAEAYGNDGPQDFDSVPTSVSITLEEKDDSYPCRNPIPE